MLYICLLESSLFPLSLSGHRHNDGTLSDSDRPPSIANDLIQTEALIGSLVSQPPQKGSPPQHSSPYRITPPDPDDPLSSAGSQSPPTLGQPVLNDNLTKKRSKSFVHDASPAEASAQPVTARKAERQVPSAASSTPVSQRYTVPLKNHDAAPGLVRAGSMRREKTEYRISSSLSSRSTSAPSVRPFASVGRRSKLAQDYTAEFLKRTAAAATGGDHWEKPPSGSTQDRPARTEASPDSPPWSQAGTPVAPAPHLVQASSPIHQPVPLVAPRMPRAPQGAEDKPTPHGAPRPDEEDNLSDAGTYTIEDEAQDKEVEEARSLIDQASGSAPPYSLDLGRGAVARASLLFPVPVACTHLILNMLPLTLKGLIELRSSSMALCCYSQGARALSLTGVWRAREPRAKPADRSRHVGGV